MIRPLLAYDLQPNDLFRLRFPLWVSPKLDGIRALAVEGVLYSRNGKPIANRRLQELAASGGWHGWDGELCDGPTNSPDLMSRTQSTVRSYDAPIDNLRYWVFDNWNRQGPWEPIQDGIFVKVLEHEKISSLDDLAFWEEEYLRHGFEGLMARAPVLYKQGRSTLREQALMKLKRFQDDEGEGIGVKERMMNKNELEKSPLGYAARSTAAEGLRPAGDLGALTVRVLTGNFAGATVDVGSGYTAAQRQALWAESPIGKTITFKHFAYGAKDRPRFPIFKAFREKE